MECNRYIDDVLYYSELKEYPDMAVLEDCIKKVYDYHAVMLHAAGKLRNDCLDQEDWNWFRRCNNELWDNCSLLHSVLVDLGVWAYKTKRFVPAWEMWFILFNECTSVYVLAEEVWNLHVELDFVPHDEEVLDLVKGKEDM